MSYPIIDNTTTLNSMDTKIDTINTNVTDLPNQIQITDGKTQSHILGENLSAGDAVCLYNDSGTAKIKKLVGDSEGATSQISTGEEAYGPAIAYDNVNGIAFSCWVDIYSPYYIHMCAGTVASDVITWGTPQASTIDANPSTGLAVAYDITADAFLIVYEDKSDSDFYAVANTVSGTTITIGTPLLLRAGTIGPNTGIIYGAWFGGCLTYHRDSSGEDLYAAVITTSGTTITSGSDYQIDAACQSGVAVCLDEVGERVFFIWGETSNSYITGSIRTISGTVITLKATFTVLASAVIGTSKGMAAVYDTTTNAIIVTYEDNDNSSYLTALAFTVDSSYAPTVGSPFVFYSNTTNEIFPKQMTHTSYGVNRFFFVENVGATEMRICDMTVDSSDLSLSFSNTVMVISPANTVNACCNFTTGNTVLIYGITSTIYPNSVVLRGSTVNQAYAVANEAGTTGQTKEVTLLEFPESLITGLSGLTPAAKYYLSLTDGQLTTKFTIYTVGRAESATSLMIRNNYFKENF